MTTAEAVLYAYTCLSAMACAVPVIASMRSPAQRSACNDNHFNLRCLLQALTRFRECVLSMRSAR